MRTFMISPQKWKQRLDWQGTTLDGAQPTTAARDSWDFCASAQGSLPGSVWPIPAARLPETIRKRRHISMAKSVRASLTMNQNPWPARVNSGIFVVTMAVEMMIRRGITVMRVYTPASTSSPQTISNVATKCAVKAG